MGARPAWHHAQRFCMVTGIVLAAAVLFSVAIAPAGSAQVPEWKKEIPITVLIEPYADVTPSPAEWLLSFTGEGRVEGGWRFVSRPEPRPAFTVHANTDVQVTLTGGGLGEQGVYPSYLFTRAGELLPAYASSAPGEGAPFPLADVTGPTGDAGVTFTLGEAAILAQSMSEVPAGRLGNTVLTITVTAAPD